jgi:hypothetical protein
MSEYDIFLFMNCEIHPKEERNLYCPLKKEFLCRLCQSSHECKAEHINAEECPEYLKRKLEDAQNQISEKLDSKDVNTQLGDLNTDINIDERFKDDLIDEVKAFLNKKFDERHIAFDELSASINKKMEDQKNVLECLKNANEDLKDYIDKLKVTIPDLAELIKICEKCNNSPWESKYQEIQDYSSDIVNIGKLKKSPFENKDIDEFKTQFASFFEAFVIRKQEVKQANGLIPASHEVILSAAVNSSSINAFDPLNSFTKEVCDLKDSLTKKPLKLSLGCAFCNYKFDDDFLLLAAGGAKDFFTTIKKSLSFSYNQ